MTLEQKIKRAEKRRRNLEAKSLREDRRYLPKRIEGKKKPPRENLSPRYIEKYISDDE